MITKDTPTPFQKKRDVVTEKFYIWKKNLPFCHFSKHICALTQIVTPHNKNFLLYRNTSAEAIFILTTSLEEADDKNEANSRIKVYAGDLLKVRKCGCRGKRCGNELNIQYRFERDFQLPENVKCPKTITSNPPFDLISRPGSQFISPPPVRFYTVYIHAPSTR
jgi:hypothetical protein